MKITSENAIEVLKDLKSSAEYYNTNYDDVIEDYRDSAEWEARDIIDTLLNMEFESEDK